MNARRAWALWACAAVSCQFQPDLSSYPVCIEGVCPTGFICLTEEARCVSACGENVICPASDAGHDAGEPDAGDVDAGQDAGEPDAGETDAGETDAGDPPLALADGGLPPATETASYQQTLQPTGGTPPYTYSLDRLDLPNEFSLATDGRILAGPAQHVGTFNFRVSVSDQSLPQQNVTAGLRLVVQPLLRIATQSPLTSGIVSQAYQEDFSATGGVGTLRFAVDGGSLPNGMTLSSTGTLGGNPGAAGTFNFNVEASDSAQPPQKSSRAYQLSVAAIAPLTLTFSTQSLADGRIGQSYSQQLRAAGVVGGGTVNWSIITGTLPAGISLTSTIGVGVLSGVPTDAGTASVTIKANDGVGMPTKALTLKIY